MKIERSHYNFWNHIKCLNPYSNGMKIEHFVSSVKLTGLNSLNPYSNGMKIELTHSLLIIYQRCLNPYSNGMKIELLMEQDFRENGTS